MNTIQHNHPASGKRYSTRVLATTNKVQTGSTFAAGEGRFDIQMGYAHNTDEKTTRTIGVELTEEEALTLSNKLHDFLMWCVAKRLEQAQRDTKEILP